MTGVLLSLSTVRNPKGSCYMIGGNHTQVVTVNA